MIRLYKSFVQSTVVCNFQKAILTTMTSEEEEFFMMRVADSCKSKGRFKSDEEEFGEMRAYDSRLIAYNQHKTRIYPQPPSIEIPHNQSDCISLFEGGK